MALHVKWAPQRCDKKIPKPKDMANVPRNAPRYLGSVYSATNMAAKGVRRPKAKPCRSRARMKSVTELPRKKMIQPSRAGMVEMRCALCRPKRFMRTGEMKFPTMPMAPTTDAEINEKEWNKVGTNYETKIGLYYAYLDRKIMFIKV